MRTPAPLLTAFLVSALIGFSVPPAFAADPAPMSTTPSMAAASFNDAQRAEIENIVKEYLTTKHPEVMAEGLQELQKREQQTTEAKTKEQVTAAKDRVYNDPNSPSVGNAKGNVTLVEFFDYQCGYCKMSEEALENLVKDDKNLKVVYKEFPILGPASAEAAKASLASVKQGKYQAFHDTLMKKKDHLSSDMIYAVAKEVGLDVDKLKKDMSDTVVTDEISATLKLGQDIGVRGTPMFIINDTVYPGALQAEQLKQAVTDARAAEKKS